MLTQSTVDMMIQPEWEADLGLLKFGFGLGFEIQEYDSILRYGHNGGTTGGVSLMYYYPEKDSYIVIVSNFSPDQSGLDEKFYGYI